MTNTKLDDKIYWMYKMLALPMSLAPYVFYPRIYKVSDIAENVTNFTQIYLISYTGLLRILLRGIAVYG